jgi:hypothetical protein
MAEKIVLGVKSRKAVPPINDALPGDGKEVFPEPASPRDVIYVHSEPPSLDGLLRRMLSQDIRPSGRFLIFLLVHAGSFEAGLDYLLDSGISRKHVNALFSPRPQYDVDRRDLLGGIPEDVFAAFIRFLCKFSTAGPKLRINELFPILFSKLTVAIESPHQSKALIHAVLLMKLRVPKYPPAWHYLLSTLATRVSMPNLWVCLSAQRIIAWRQILEVLAWMGRADMDLEITALQIICSALARAIEAAHRDIEGAERGLKIVQQLGNAKSPLNPAKIYLTVSDMFQEGIDLLKKEFYRLVLPEENEFPSLANLSDSGPNSVEATAVLPREFVVPAPAQLHAFIRVLGLAQDIDGLVALVNWMSRSAKDLKLAADERLGGRSLMRRAIVAIRVFLEWHLEHTSSKLAKGNSGELLDEDDDSFDGSQGEDGLNYGEEKPPSNCISPQIFSDPRVQEAYNLIESTEFLSPWPTDAEVQLYLSRRALR